MKISDIELEHLEWPRILQALADKAAGGAARTRLLVLGPAQSFEEMRLRLESTDQWRRALGTTESSPLGGYSDQAPLLDLIAQDGIPEAGTLYGFSLFCKEAVKLGRWVKDRREILVHDFPEAEPFLEEIQRFKRISDLIDRCVGADGEILPTASPEIAKLKKRVERGRMEVRKEIQRAASKYKSELESDTYTLYGDRYVLLMKVGAQNQHEGIIHGFSASGASVYFEPKAVVSMTNQIALSESELVAAYRKVLRDLARGIAPDIDYFAQAHEWTVACDMKLSMGKLAAEMRGTAPNVLPHPGASLIQMRHPGMVLMRKEVVSNDIRLGGDSSPNQAFIVSGPNAGGKTVVLKCVGLGIVMAHVGLLPPVDPGSSVGYCRKIQVLMGDDQDLDAGLSTFSSHIQSLNRLLDASDDGSLLLLDEIATGTEPREGEAIAIAYLEAFVDRGSHLLVTTHYEGIKRLADADSRFEVGAMGFDDDGAQPTYRLQMGTAGHSRAIAVAKLMGAPEPVLDSARKHFAGGVEEAANLMKRLERMQEQLAEERRQLKSAMDENKSLEERLADKHEKLDVSRQRFLDDTREKMKDQLRSARGELLEFRKELKKAKKGEDPQQVSEKAAEELSRLEKKYVSIEKAGEKTAQAKKGPPADIHRLKVGDRVYIPEANGAVTITEIKKKQGRIVVAIGAMKMESGMKGVRVASASEPSSKKPKPAPEIYATPPTEVGDCDIRGMSVDESYELVRRLLDSALLGGVDTIRIIHGHGTGRLRHGVHAYLKKMKHVGGFKDAPPHEGGAGVTVVTLA